MLETARDNNAEAIFGSRIANPGSGKSYQRYYWGGRFLTVLANLLYGLGITDESTCYKMVKTEATILGNKAWFTATIQVPLANVSSLITTIFKDLRKKLLIQIDR